MGNSFLCLWCGNSFSDKPSRKRRCCSRICLRNWLARNRVKYICNVCGSDFFCPPGRTGVKFCSNACKSTYYRSKNIRPYGRIWDGSKQVLEHRWVMEKFLGRKLSRYELVHHINGDKRDNRLSNLSIVNQSKHSIVHSRAKFNIALAIKLRGKGLNFTQIARKLGCHPWSINYSLSIRGF